MAGLQLPILSFSQTDTLDKILVGCAIKDVPFVIQSVAAQEIQDQVSFGNPPTSIIVDSSGRKPITSAQRRVQAFFTDKDDIRRAVYEAWNRILNLTRVRTGRAASTYELWFNDTRIGRTPAVIETYLSRMDPSKDFFRIVGPVIVYGRKIYWSPRGKPRIKKITAYRSKTLAVKLLRIKGIMYQVRDAMRRKYRNVGISEQWVVTSVLPKDGRTPGLRIGFKRRGSTLAPKA